MKRYGNIFIKNVYYMLSYAFQVLKQSNFEDVATEDFDNIHNLFAAILGKGIGQQLKQGLFREYINRNEDIPVLRGKIDINGTIRNQIAHRQVLTCEYDELSENNLFNQILKTTVLLLIRSNNVDKEYKDILKKEMLFFSGVEAIEPLSVSWTNIRFNRNNQTYRMLISLCQLIIEGMLLTTEEGEHRLASFFIDEHLMCRLYEKFLLEYYRKEYPQIQATASQIPWALDDGHRTMLPIMQSDVMLSYQDAVLIIDAKFYSHTLQTHYSNTIHSGNLYQIFTYVKNKEAELAPSPHKVSGMLLYARTDETVQPDESYSMSGNRIDVRTLDLNCDFLEIKAQLNHIAEEFFGL